MYFVLRGGTLQAERGYTFAIGGALCVEKGYTLQ